MKVSGRLYLPFKRRVGVCDWSQVWKGGTAFTFLRIDVVPVLFLASWTLPLVPSGVFASASFFRLFFLGASSSGGSSSANEAHLLQSTFSKNEKSESICVTSPVAGCLIWAGTDVYFSSAYFRFSEIGPKK
jgi:hypothetical protein